MRILQFIQKKQLRGAEVFACQLSNHLLAKGHQVKMLALMDGEASMPFRGDVEVLGIDYRSRMIDIKGWRKLSKLINQFKPDIVQANAADTLKYAAFSKKLFGWKAKLIFRNANKMGDFINAGWKKAFNKWLLNEVDFTASVSEECKVDFIKTFQWPTTKIETLPIGVEVAQFSTYNPFLEKGMQNRFPILLHVAGFVPEKNHVGLLRIVDALRQTYPDVLLVMIGDGKLKNTIVDVAGNMGLNEHVLFVGRSKEVPAFMQHSNALVMPSLIEGLPGVILEAFAYKLPVVAYDVGGIKEVIHHGKTGWLITKNDERSFTSCLKNLFEIENRDLQNILCNAEQLVTSKYQNDLIALKFEQRYYKLLGSTYTASNLLS